MNRGRRILEARAVIGLWLGLLAPVVAIERVDVERSARSGPSGGAAPRMLVQSVVVGHFVVSLRHPRWQEIVPAGSTIMLYSAGSEIQRKAEFRGSQPAAERISFQASRKSTYSADSGTMPKAEKKPAPERETDVLRSSLDVLRERLPQSWEAVIDEEVPVDGLRADALVRIRSPDGAPAMLVVEAKRLVEARDLPLVLAQLSRMIEAIQAGVLRGPTDVVSAASGAVVPMVVARYLAPPTRERLEDVGANYADATGNLRVVIDHPALFLRDVGAQRDPWRGPGRPRGSFRGPVAARVVRALADFTPPMTVPELVERSGASTGATYRMVDLLEREAYIEREPRGPITRVDWRRMLERWSEDYGFAPTNPTSSFLQPRGLPALLEALRSISDVRYAITGSVAAGYFARYAPARLAMAYVEDPDRAADRLGLRPVDGGANVLVAAPKDDFVYERARVIDELNVAAPSQVAVDLLTSPGRGPSEAVALLDWMQEDERAWRG